MHNSTHTSLTQTHSLTAFTELQTDLADLVQISDDKNLPYRDFRSFAMRFLFPSAGDDHPVLNPLAITNSEEAIPHLETFRGLILDRKFLLLFVRTLEAQQGRFSLQDKYVYFSRGSSFFFGKVTALGVLCCFALLFVSPCLLIILPSFLIHLSNMFQ